MNMQHLYVEFVCKYHCICSRSIIRSRYLTGEQIAVRGNVIEGNGGPGIIACAAPGLEISANYFEANNNAACGPPLTMVPENCTGCNSLQDKPNITSSSDIILSGAPSFHNGDSYVGPDGFAFGYPKWTYGGTYPSYSVVIEGNFHSGGGNFSAVLAIAVHSLVLTGNQCYRNRCTNDALIETGTDADLFNVRDVTMLGACVETYGTILTLVFTC